MPTKPIPEAYRAATPYLIVHDAAQAIEFYKKAFGAQEMVRLADSAGNVMHAEIRIGEAPIMLANEFPEEGYRGPQALGGSPVSMLLYVEDVDAVFNRVASLVAREKKAVADQFDGDCRGTLVDPFGHTWLLATKQIDISFEELQKRFAAMMNSGTPS